MKPSSLLKKITFFVAFLFTIILIPKTSFAYTAGAFVTEWTVPSDNLTITIPTDSNYSYNYNVDWGDSTTPDSGDTGGASHTYAASGVYDVTITGTFPAIYFNSASDAPDLTNVLQWGNNSWQSMYFAFAGCTSLTTFSASDTPDLSNVTDMSNMFLGDTSFNSDISGWNISNVTNMQDMLSGEALSTSNYDNLLARWSIENVQTNVNFGAGQSHYCSAPGRVGRSTLMGSDSWTITDGGGCPYISSATVNGSTLTVTYNEPLATTSVPIPTDFVVDDNGTSYTISNVSISGSSVILTLATAVLAQENVTISYFPGTNQIEDSSGNLAIPLSDYSLTNNTPAIFTYTAGLNGTLIGTTLQTVAPGDIGTPVTAVPDPGYTFLEWSDGDTDNPRTDTAYNNVSVTAEFVSSCGLITVGNTPTASILVGKDLYVLNAQDNTVSVVDTQTNIVTTTLSVGQDPRSVVLNKTNLYVINQKDGTVSVINTTTNTVTNTIVLTITNPDLEIMAGTDLYVFNEKGHTSIVDTTNNTVVDGVTVGEGSFSPTLVGTNLYVLSHKYNDVYVIDTTNNMLVGSPISTGRVPSSAILVGTDLYITNQKDSTVSVIDTTNNIVTTTIRVDDDPISATLVGNNLLYVANIKGGDFSIINTTTNTVTNTVSINPELDFVILDGTNLYILDNHENTVSVFDTQTNTITSTISVGSSPGSATLAGNNLYVLNNGANNISIINTLTNNTLTCSAPSVPSTPIQASSGTVSGGGGTITWTPQTGFIDHSKTQQSTTQTNQVITPLPIFTKNLKKGSVSQDVKRLQIYLRLHGFTVVSEGKETTTFGIKTKTELVLFQKSVGLDVDGSFGPKTRVYVNGHE